MYGSYNSNAHPRLHEVCCFGNWLSWFVCEVPARFCSTHVHWLALHHMKSRKERSDCIDPGRLWGLSSSFHTHVRRAASGFQWMLDGASRFEIRWCFQIFRWSRRSFAGVDIPSVSSTSALRPGMWFVVDYRWDESSGGKVLKFKLGFVMALDGFFLAYKVMSYGQSS